MSLTRSSVTLPRMNAHRLVVVAAALTTVVAAALATALAIFSSQALPRAVRHDLSHASGTALAINGTVPASQAAQYTALLPGLIRPVLDGTPFAFYQAKWSDPLGFVPGALPATPVSAGNQPIAEAAELGGITGQAALVSGHWPGAPVSGQPIPAALPTTAAALLHVTVGDVLRLQDRVSKSDVRFVITGLYRPREVTSEYWALDEVALAGQSTSSGFTTYGPLTVQAAAFAGALTVDSGSWLAEPQAASIPASHLTDVAGNVGALQQELENAQSLNDLALSTNLPAVLEGTASNLDVARSLLAICAVLLGLLAAAALLATARLLADEREGESAMLAARGATRWQLLRLTAGEAIPLCLLSAAAGGAVGVPLARLLTQTGSVPLRDVWPAAAAVGVGALLIMLVPALTTVTPGTARARRGRAANASGITRAGIDVALVLLAVVAGWQLRHYSAVSAGASGNYSVDPVIVIAPALALAGGTVLALRLLPAGGRAGDKLAARGRRLTAALASWQISRQPIRQGGAALLIVLAVATGTLALSQRQSWTRSDHDQAAFGSGADVRVETSEPLSSAQAATLVGLPGVRHAMPVAVFPQASGGETLAIGAGQAANVALLRPDQTPLPEADLFRKILPGTSTPGVALPGHPAEVQLTARLGPASLGLDPVVVSISVQDADGDVYQFNAGTLPADGRDHTLTVPLGAAAGTGGQARALYPLRLTAISLVYTMPGARPRAPGVFAVDSVSGGPGTTPVAGSALHHWLAAATSPELSGVRQTFGTSGPSGFPGVSSSVAQGSQWAVTFGLGYGLAASGFPGIGPSTMQAQLALAGTSPVAALPGLATQHFLASTHAHLGSVVQTDVNGAIFSVRIVQVVSSFPTVSAGSGALILDLGGVQDQLASSALQAAQVTQWWLATSRMPAGLAASLPPGSAVVSTQGVAAGLLSDPLSTVPQQGLLAVALAAAVLAITGFCVSIAAGVRQRRSENALLAALGVPPRVAAGQLCLEKLMLSLPSALAGLVLGGVLAELLVPAITLSPSATVPVPPVLIQFGWSQTLPLALAVAVIPVLAAALTITRRPDPAAALRAAEAA
jgi:hypothetical protein